MIFVLVTTRLAVQGDFTINITLQGEILCNEKCCRWGVTPLSFSSLTPTCIIISCHSHLLQWRLSQLFLEKVDFDVGMKEKCFFPKCKWIN